MPSARKTSQVIGRVSKSHLLKKSRSFFTFQNQQWSFFFYIDTAQIPDMQDWQTAVVGFLQIFETAPIEITATFAFLNFNALLSLF